MSDAESFQRPGLRDIVWKKLEEIRHPECVGVMRFLEVQCSIDMLDHG